MMQQASGRRVAVRYQVAISMLLGFFSLACFCQQIYKWKDVAGTVHYSEKAPPKGMKGSQMNLSTNGNGDSGNPADSPPMATTPEDQAALDTADKKQRAHLCTVAKQNLKLLDSDAMIASGTDLDTATQLRGEQRQAARSEATAQIARNCHDQ